MSRSVVVIAGPTASGKSALALAAAEAFGGIVINADSMQVYRELAILTARPGAAALARAPHRLYGVLSAREACSAGRWLDMALGEIAAAHGEGRLPVVVGGTGLYLKALIEGLSPMPAVPARVRAAVRARLARLGAEAFHAELEARDPETAARLAPGDSQRLVRAWEVLEATGRPLSAWQTGRRNGKAGELAFRAMTLSPERRALYAACDRRFEQMVVAGAVEEVRALLALGLDPELPTMKAVGVRELGRHVRGEIPLAQAIALGQRATRQYAKRQMTWFRRQMAEARVLSAQDSESLKEEIFSFIRHFC